MTADDQADDIAAIEALIARQFAALSWTPETPADWNGFADDFTADATLYPSARPAKSQSVTAFLARMKGLAGTTLRSLQETALGAEIIVSGNVAVAVAPCEMVENGSETSRNVEMMLLVKTEGRWRIAAQDWDKAGGERPVLRRFLADLS
jgi:hypothetical protein